MKQLIYRREDGASTGVGGYTVTARADSITAMQRSEALKQARLPQLADENLKKIKNSLNFYRQFPLDADTVAVSCGFYDPHDQRGSAIVHTAMTESPAERSAYFSRLPAASGYFARIKDEYAATKAMKIEKGDMLVSLEDFFSGAACRHSELISILTKELGSREIVHKLFSALLDVCGSNPRMIVVFLDASDLSQVAERGRRIAEALFACLPDSIACATGWMSPALDDGDNSTFGLRFALKGNFRFGGAQSQAYVFDLTDGAVTEPRQADMLPSEYVRALSAWICNGDPDAVSALDKLRAGMDDPSLIRRDKAKGKGISIPAEMRLRYLLSSGNLSGDFIEMRRALDWRHAMIDEGLSKNSEGFERFGFWDRVNQWTLDTCLPEIWKNRPLWKKGHALYDPDVVLRIFDDSQRLHAAGRQDALGYRQFVQDRLDAGDLDGDSARLIKFFIDCAAKTRIAPPLKSQLYFDPVESWMRGTWLKNRPAPRSRDVMLALDQLCAADALPEDRLRAYVNAYSTLIFDGRDALYVPNESKFHALVVQAVLRNAPEKLLSCLRADVHGKNPYTTNGTMPLWQWYRRLAGQDPDLEAELIRLNRANFDAAMARCTPESVPALVDELHGAGLGIIAAAGRLDPQLNARERIEARILSLSGNICQYYPEKIALAGEIAMLSRKHQGSDRLLREHDALCAVCNMSADRLTMEDFDRFAAILGSFRPEVAGRARELLNQSLRRAAGESGCSESLLIGLAMLTLGEDPACGLTFCPDRMASELENLGLREQKLMAVCKKATNEDACEGVGYLACATRDCLKLSAKKRSGDCLAYPRMRAPRRRAPLSRLPIAVPIAGMILFGGGLAVSVLGLLQTIGLM